MYGVVLLLVVALLSLLITRVATIALTATGMPRPSARFQARSALSGVGFTTNESESVVAHPARRRIIMALMLIGSVGLATSIAGVLAGLVGGTPDDGDRLARAGVLLAGLAAIYTASMSKRVDRRLSKMIGRALARFTDLDVRDYAALLHISGEYEVKEMVAAPGAWMTGRELGELRLRDEGLVVLGIVRTDGSYLGVPTKNTRIEAGDTVILYGRDERFAELTARPAGEAGDQAHRAAVAAQHHSADQETGPDHAAGRS